jgi:hypothetical protein
MPNFGVQIRNLGPWAAAWVRGLQQQLYQAPDQSIEGVSPAHWPSAMQPVRPIGGRDAQPLAIRLMQAMNLMFQPRSDATYTSQQLKDLAQYPLARICIDNTKDVIGDVRWKIQPKPKPGETKREHDERAKGDTNLLSLSKFFEWPNRSERQNWTEWTRQLCDEMLTIDAGTLLVRKTRKGTVAELPVIPGDTIVRYVDDNGFTPKPPSPAYAQLWEGMPRVNLTTDQLIYKPRNIVWRQSVSSQLYGCSPTEALATELDVGIQRLAFVDAFYLTGNLPSALQVIPVDAPPDKVKLAFELLDSELSGNLAKRRGIRALQGFSPEGKDQIVFPPSPALADSFDEVHLRKVCFAYGTSPQRLLHMMNRATAETNQEAADAEGLLPWLPWIRGIVNLIIQVLMGFDDYEFVFELDREQDIAQQMTAMTGYVEAQVMTRAEVREKLDLDPRSEANVDKLGLLTPQGFVELDKEMQEQVAPPGGEPVPRGPGGARKPPQQVAEVEPKPGRGGKKVLKLVLTD